MHNLLQPGGAALGEWRNEEVAGLGPVHETVPGAFRHQRSLHLLQPLAIFAQRSGAGPSLERRHEFFSLISPVGEPGLATGPVA